jgi:hypothetical protein
MSTDQDKSRPEAGTEEFAHHYSVILRAGKCYIMEDGKSDEQHLTFITDEPGARWIAAMWNAWGSKYDRRNPKCHQRLPQAVHQLWLASVINLPLPDEEDDDRVLDDEPRQPTLWDDLTGGMA